MPKRNKLDFESALAELETLVSRMEQGEVSLEESLRLYERGVKLSQLCQETLRDAEQKVQILQQKQGKEQINDFPNEE
ncbi:exodeoxyribonuclease VII small subunit [Nitrosococcus oceani]|uniref:Exodeoxyribonuclease 7 small subunit n=2 Tax=Nitrosococcus oceani TaxID=1229 RepID=Q3J9K0_NITOC|nr:exodeoxyribonuclease VII small subunit [Nitrosococcus oceani]KFI19100.1 exodeoxyribonuclease VII small subunit [Nitrosococcus oceani C-27]ABA58496.1 Exodeoxyribonuclease VII small subunit [Nitrosococcus oceani ATCC 19707]EDZ66704.1 exodeoxyribonuclease VII, small subunit [Nitrosococcus oceani AFC27]KFI22317.1 exodeoxyribonuclease VII small subunit [Nitrosococcus oceani]GEM18894.1 exodeoxyribonuclease VII small subunit [Nitrosococcus oceani]